MLGQSRILGAGRRRLLSKILLLCALGAALLLAACGRATNASTLGSGINALAMAGATPDAQGFMLAGNITPASPTAVAGGGGSGDAPALFGGQIGEMITNNGESVWQVGGRAVHVTSATQINDSVGQPQVGAHVTVGGQPRSDGGADAAWIRVDATSAGAASAGATGAGTTVDLTAQPPVTATEVAPAGAATAAPQQASGSAASAASQATAAPSQAPGQADNASEASHASTVYCGFIEQLPQSGIVGDWRVSNRTVHVGQSTKVQAQGNRFDLGWFAFVRGVLQGDGSMNAQQIIVRPPGNDRCLPGLRVGQNNGQGQGNGNDKGQGASGNPGKGKGNKGGNGNKGGKGKGH